MEERRRHPRGGEERKLKETNRGGAEKIALIFGPFWLRPQATPGCKSRRWRGRRAEATTAEMAALLSKVGGSMPARPTASPIYPSRHLHGRRRRSTAASPARGETSARWPGRAPLTGRAGTLANPPWLYPRRPQAGPGPAASFPAPEQAAKEARAGIVGEGRGGGRRLSFPRLPPAPNPKPSRSPVEQGTAIPRLQSSPCTQRTRKLRLLNTLLARGEIQASLHLHLWPGPDLGGRPCGEPDKGGLSPSRPPALSGEPKGVLQNTCACPLSSIGEMKGEDVDWCHGGRKAESRGGGG